MTSGNESEKVDNQKRQGEHIEKSDENGVSEIKRSGGGKDSADRDSSATKGGADTRPPADS